MDNRMDSPEDDYGAGGTSGMTSQDGPIRRKPVTFKEIRKQLSDSHYPRYESGYEAVRSDNAANFNALRRINGKTKDKVDILLDEVEELSRNFFYVRRENELQKEKIQMLTRALEQTLRTLEERDLMIHSVIDEITSRQGEKENAKEA